ncbi:hypothetical protein AB2B41_14675 [Marimonas sp. MJW-29]|uniref:Uncharacterized protein n=1 Tax=Sulfitobacter sediminis TaxID=3234186 RepID=A0ABV3RPG2_9RHOB
MTVRVLGISSKNGGLHELLPMKSKGKFQLHKGDSAKERKTSKPVLRDNIEDAIAEIRNGLHPRMTNVSQRGQAPDIMAPNSLIILRQNADGTWTQEKT